MSFRRTDAGLSALHAFYGVQYVVLTEGGTSGCVRDGATVDLDELCADVVFWESIFGALAPGVRTKCLAFGSKTGLMDVVAAISAGRVDNCIIAVDRDVDDLCGAIQHPYLFRTRGYSWENDIIQEQIAHSAFERLATSATELAQVKRGYTSRFDEVLRRLGRAFRLDLVFLAKGIQAVCVDRVGRFLHIGQSVGIDFAQYHSVLKRRKSEARKLRPLPEISAPVDLLTRYHGKTLLKISYLCAQASAVHSFRAKAFVSSDMYERMLLSTWKQRFRISESYYKQPLLEFLTRHSSREATREFRKKQRLLKLAKALRLESPVHACLRWAIHRRLSKQLGSDFRHSST